MFGKCRGSFINSHTTCMAWGGRGRREGEKSEPIVTQTIKYSGTNGLGSSL